MKFYDKFKDFSKSRSQEKYFSEYNKKIVKKKKLLENKNQNPSK